MDWMHTHQLSSKNLTAGEKVAMTMELQKEIALENKEKQLSTLKQNQINNRSVQMDKTESDERSHTAHTHTREQVAKMSGVGIGTVARYNRVMNSDDEAKQRKVAVEYVKLCGYKNGGDRKSDFHNGNVKLTLDQIAEQLGTSKTNLTRALSIERNLTESMKQLLDDGVISKTVQQRKLENVLKNWKDCMELRLESLITKKIRN